MNHCQTAKRSPRTFSRNIAVAIGISAGAAFVIGMLAGVADEPRPVPVQPAVQPAVQPVSIGFAAADPSKGKDTAKQENTLALDALRFMVGRWVCELPSGGRVEEHWSAPHGTSIMGMFRWCNAAGQATLFELEAITAEPEGVFLRLRHHSATLVAKEEANKPVTLRLAEAEGMGTTGRAVFKARMDTGDLKSITYSREGQSLKVVVAFIETANRPALEFEMVPTAE